MEIKQKPGRNSIWVVFNQKYAVKVIILLLLTSTLAVYWQVQEFDFVNFDDPGYITENKYVRNGLTSQGLVWAFSEFRAGNWHPVTWISHMLDVQLFGLNPGWHHLVNVLFHFVNTLLLFFVLRNMTGSLWRSAFVAALFALHPIHVESVAWISERKDVLSAFFCLLTIFFYHRYAKQPSMAKYLLVTATMVLGLMSKPMLVTLPFILLLLDFWPLSRPGSQLSDPGPGVISIQKALPLVREKIPLLLLVAASSIVTVFAQKQGGAVISMETLGAGARIGNAINSYLMYIIKMFIPWNFAVFYPHPKTLPLLNVVGSSILLVGMLVLVFRLRKKFPYLLFGWLWYLGTMVPVIGLVQVGNQAMADRYTYIPLIGLFIMISWGAADLFGKFARGKLWASVLTVFLLTAMMTMTWAQTGYWKNSITLFEHALSVTTENATAHTNLGRAYADKGQIRKALEHYRAALKIDPEFVMAHNNMGKILDGQGKTQEAIRHYLIALQINPDFVLAHNNLGSALDRQGRIREALDHYRMALEIDPDFEVAHNNLGIALENMGSREMAIIHFQKAIQINPGFSDAHHNLGVTLLRIGQMELAAYHLQKAVELNNTLKLELPK
jgi:Tfp pilus assembly protein PilF